MKVTIDFDDALYLRLKVEAAKRGRSIRDLVTAGVRHVLSPSSLDGAPPPSTTEATFAPLREYAKNADGEHDLPALRRSVVKGRSKRL